MVSMRRIQLRISRALTFIECPLYTRGRTRGRKRDRDRDI